MKSFDYITHLRNKKGKIYATQPYRMFVSKEGVKLERPPGSGEFFNPDGTPVKTESVAKPPQEVVKKQEEKPVLNEVKLQAKRAEIKSKAKIEVGGED